MLIKKYVFSLVLIILIFSTNACNVQVERNSDGSLKVETTMTEAVIQTEITAALADPLIQNVEVDLKNGYILVTAERRRLKGDQTDALNFLLALGASQGKLTASISEARLNDLPVDSEWVAVWNQRIANRLARTGQRNPNSTLQTVTIGSDDLKLVWRVETARSRDG